MGTAAAVASVYNIVNRLLTSWPRGMLGIRLLLLSSPLLSSPLSSLSLSLSLSLRLSSATLVRSIRCSRAIERHGRPPLVRARVLLLRVV